MNKPRWPFALIASYLLLITACTKRNPDLCCTTDAECSAIGFSSHAPCDLGVCVKNECTTTPNTCDDDSDCAAGTLCVAGSCAACASSATCPTAAPVCDAVAHDCRLCTKDSECASLVCDLVMGSCVDPAQIRYASPTGDETKPCSRALPCSIGQAATMASSEHPYVALIPGAYHKGASFDGVTAIICGNDSTYDANGGSSFVIRNGASVTFRDLNISQTDATDQNDSTIIASVGSSLTLNNMHFEVAAPSFSTISQFTGIALTIYHSTFKGAAISIADTTVTIDQSSFLDDTSIDIDDVGKQTNITNSIFDMPSHGLLRIRGDSSDINQSSIHGNTFFGGSIDCKEDGTFTTYFDANIFYNTALFPGSGSAKCIYNHNIMSPALAVPGMDNRAVDPMFVSLDRHDFHLQAGSPAIDPPTDAESDTARTSHDFDATPRPQGVRNDIGAFEYVAPAAP